MIFDFLRSQSDDLARRLDNLNRDLTTIILGKLTKQELLDWLTNQEILRECKYCALYWNRDQKTVSAFLLSAEKDFLYSNGIRQAVVFKAEGFDPDMYMLFRGAKSNLVLLDIDELRS